MDHGNEVLANDIIVVFENIWNLANIYQINLYK